MSSSEHVCLGQIRLEQDSESYKVIGETPFYVGNLIDSSKQRGSDLLLKLQLKEMSFL